MDCPPDVPLLAYRIADGRHPLFDGTGASLNGARWNSPGRSVIYAAATYAGAMLEVLAHAGIGRLPRHTSWIEIKIPAGVSRECPELDALPGWDNDDYLASRAFGDAWLSQQRTAVLLVPSVVARQERNLLINPAHPDFQRIVATEPLPVEWDWRLFARSH
jgi:RES domain-containing protein